MNQPPRLVLQKPDALPVVKVGNLWDKLQDVFSCVLGDVGFEQSALNVILQTFIGEVDAELVEGIRSPGRILRTWEIEEADEGRKVVPAKALVDVLIQPDTA